jgi:hypothetical protein
MQHINNKELNGIIKEIVFDDVNIVRENIDTVKKSTETLLDAIKVVGLEENPEKTKYMLMSRSQKIGKKHSIR